MSTHIVSSYDTELENLRRSISEMGGIAEKMMTDSGNALVRRDVPLAHAVIAADKRLDAIQHEVEERAILLIAKRQPLAIDLRETISAIRVSNDLERIGDLSKNVAKRVVAIADQIQPQKIVIGVQHMGDLVQEQLKDVLDAYGSPRRATHNKAGERPLRKNHRVIPGRDFRRLDAFDQVLEALFGPLPAEAPPA